MQILVSLALLISGLFILFHSDDADLKNFASGWVGAVSGYWLR